MQCVAGLCVWVCCISCAFGNAFLRFFAPLYPPSPAFEDAQKRAIMSSGVFPSVAAAMLAFPRNEDIAAYGAVFFYFIVEEVIRGHKSRRLPDEALIQVGAM